MATLKKLIALIIIIQIVFVVALPVLGSLNGSGYFQGLWTQVIEVIPFGNAVAELALKIYTEVFSNIIDSKEYLAGVSAPKGFLEYSQEFCKLVLSAVLYAAVKFFGDKVMGIDSLGSKVIRTRSGAIKSVKDNSIIGKVSAFLFKSIWAMFCAFFCALAANWVLGIAFSQINQAISRSAYVLANIGMTLVNGVVVAGGVWILICVLGVSLGLAIGYMLVNIILVNICKLAVSSACLSLMLICIIEQEYIKLIDTVGIWLILAIIIYGIEMMISSVFKAPS